ncbi:MAG: ABC transporter substrate-binding protein [Halanaeroarchaeum sp.]
MGLVAAVNEAGARLGPWKNQGLDVNYKISGGSLAAAKSVASGKDAFGNGGFGAVLQLIESGAPLKIIGVCTSPFGGVITKKSSGIRTWKDLEGTTVGQIPYGSTAPVAKAAMRKRGVDPSKITFQNVQPGAGVKLMMEGKLDSIIRYVPQTSARLEHAGIETVSLLSADVLDHLGVALYTRKEIANSHPELVNKFTRGWLNAFQVWATDFDEVLQMYKPLMVGEPNMEVERMYLGPLYASQVPNKDIGLEHGKGWVPEQKMTNTIEAFKSAGLLDSSPSIDDVFTNRFLRNNEQLAIETAKALYDRLKDFKVGPNYM